MPPLMCASVTDTYGPNFGKYAGLTSEEIIKKVKDENIKCADENNKAQEKIKTEIIAGEAKFVDNKNLSYEAPRQGFTNILGNFPSNTGNTFLNRFQSKEFYSSEDRLIDTLEQILLCLKIICIVLILLLVIYLTKRN